MSDSDRPPIMLPETDEDDVRIIEVVDERDPLAESALDVIAEMFKPHERQPRDELRSELAERRLGVGANHSFHLLVAVAGGQTIGTIAGLYMDAVNAGFITYLAVRVNYRGRRVARLLRPALIECFRRSAQAAGHEDVAWVLGEVRAKSPWLRRLVRTRGAVPFDLTYYHPGMSLDDTERYVLYRQPVGDHRRTLPSQLVRRIIFTIYRRAYRVRYPLQRDIFQAMLRQLEHRPEVGVHPEFAHLLDRFDERCA